uniref:Uncharacterized protein n=1 Tax=Anguilla anguilla TaxID=7936 RepID=A0A0E9WLU8_ANGAN
MLLLNLHQQRTSTQNTGAFFISVRQEVRILYLDRLQLHGCTLTCTSSPKGAKINK